MRAFTALFVTLSLTSGALAAPLPAKPAPAPATAEKAPTTEEKCAARFEGAKEGIAKLETRLVLTPAQKPLFAAWKNARIEDVHSLHCPALPFMDAPMPARQQNQITMMTEALAALRRELPLTTALYKVLTPAQRKTFDMPRR